MNPVTLIESANALELALMSSDGELTPELEVEISRLEKNVDAVSIVSSRLESSAQYWAEKAAKADRMSKSLLNLKQRLKEGIKQGMIASGLKELKGVETRFVLVEGQKKLVLDGHPIDPAMCVVSYQPDKSRIRELLLSGGHVEGATLEGGYQLREYINRQATNPATALKT
jgi:hypothetical protein